MANPHQEAALKSLARLMNDKKYSDLTIECQGGRKFYVHKLIVCSASEVLAAECENDMLEKKSGIIKHEEFDGDAMERMISYIYKQTYEIEGEEEALVMYEPSENSEAIDAAQNVAKVPINMNQFLIAHVEVYGIAEYYGIDKLKNLATERFEKIAKVGGMWIEDFVQVITAINDRTPPDDDELRGVLRRHAARHHAKLIGDKKFMQALRALQNSHNLSVTTWDLELAMKDEVISELDSKCLQIEALFRKNVGTPRCANCGSYSKDDMVFDKVPVSEGFACVAKCRNCPRIFFR